MEQEYKFTLKNNDTIQGVVIQDRETFYMIDETTAFGDMVIVQKSEIKEMEAI